MDLQISLGADSSWRQFIYLHYEIMENQQVCLPSVENRPRICSEGWVEGVSWPWAWNLAQPSSPVWEMTQCHWCKIIHICLGPKDSINKKWFGLSQIDSICCSGLGLIHPWVCQSRPNCLVLSRLSSKETFGVSTNIQHLTTPPVTLRNCRREIASKLLPLTPWPWAWWLKQPRLKVLSKKRRFGSHGCCEIRGCKIGKPFKTKHPLNHSFFSEFSCRVDPPWLQAFLGSCTARRSVDMGDLDVKSLVIYEDSEDSEDSEDPGRFCWAFLIC